MQNQFISAAATASADGDRGLFYMACLSVDNLEMPVPMDERQAAELAHAALVRAADTLRAQLGPAAEGDGEPSGDCSEESVADSNASDSHEEDSSSDSDSDSGDDYDYDSAESDDSADGLIADYTGAVDDSRFCDRCRAWGHTNNYCGSLPANKRRRVE